MGDTVEKTEITYTCCILSNMLYSIYGGKISVVGYSGGDFAFYNIRESAGGISIQT